jgi:hypothetical protein
MMHERGKSALAIVAVKPTNKAGRPAAEPVEPRVGTKGNADQQNARRAQNRESASSALDRIRRVAISDLPSPTRGGRRMRESRTYGVVRGALSNECPYRDRAEIPAALSSKLVCAVRQANFVIAL